ncbi:hypothetical protein OESDEN_05240 [Oesophagostomum dentatum]|uniref:TIL domain-containing protein n=1 Tax=Oesophagostomum dentatum TaxID=61180 RepID=A0A0B1TFE4_OESDE|nr:hypothetical protein OESDEN_05240 [Oesophagostomum dentatum]
MRYPPACRCKKGFFRTSEGKCTDDCSKEKCSVENMVRVTCGVPFYCQPDCSRPNWDDVLKTTEQCQKKTCIPHACECKPGFVLKEQYYMYPTCIPEEECKNTINKTAVFF